MRRVTQMLAHPAQLADRSRMVVLVLCLALALVVADLRNPVSRS